MNKRTVPRSVPQDNIKALTLQVKHDIMADNI